jgi:hypothetical protein
MVPYIGGIVELTLSIGAITGGTTTRTTHMGFVFKTTNRPRNDFYYRDKSYR